MIEEKASRPLLSANLRILVSADSQEKSDNILKEIESAFCSLPSPRQRFEVQKLERQGIG